MTHNHDETEWSRAHRVPHLTKKEQIKRMMKRSIWWSADGVPYWMPDLHVYADYTRVKWRNRDGESVTLISRRGSKRTCSRHTWPSGGALG